MGPPPVDTALGGVAPLSAPESGLDNRRPTRWTLRSRLAWFAFGSTLLTVLAVGTVAVYSTYASLRERVTQTQSVALRWSAERLQASFDAGAAEIEDLVSGEALESWRSAPATPDAAKGARDAVLTRILIQELTQRRMLSGLLVVAPDGAPRAAVGSDPSLTALFQILEPRHDGNPGVRHIAETSPLPTADPGLDGFSLQAIDLGQGSQVLVASIPLRDSRERPLGTLHGVYGRQAIAAALHTDLLGSSGVIQLVDSSGQVVAAGRDLARPLRAIPAELLAAGGTPRIRRSEGPDASWVIPSARRLDVAGLTLVAQQDLAEVAEPLVSVLTGILAIGTVLVLLVAWRAASLAEGVARSARTLSESAQRIWQGEVGVEIPDAEIPAELDPLARGYDEVEQCLRRSRELASDNHALTRRIEALQTENASLSKLSITDGLTRLNNHRFFQDQLTTELKRMTRDGKGLSMLIIDIDDFKKLNDQYGHAAGDEILMQIARLMSELVRGTDLLARYGGEEFVVVATGTDLGGAAVLAEKIRTGVAESKFIIDDTMRPRGVTVSIGVAQFSGNRNKMFQAADNALYQAKEAGKNCVIAADAE